MFGTLKLTEWWLVETLTWIIVPIVTEEVELETLQGVFTWGWRDQ